MRVLSVATLSVLLAATASAQGPAPAPALNPRGAAVGFMHAIHASNNLEVTTAFYKEVFGVSSPIRPFASDGPKALTNSPNANLRVSMLNLPGQSVNFELTEFTNTPVRKTGQVAEISDPGAPHMKFLVKDLTPVVAGVAKMGLEILTSTKQPVTFKTATGEAKGLVFRDPDGYIVHAIEVPAPADAPAGNIVGAIMMVTVRDMDADMKFWRDRMGLEMTGDGKWSTDKALLDLYGVGAGASVRSLSSVFPNSPKARIEFIEFKGMPRKEFSIRVTDPGASGMAFRVSDIDKLLPKLKAEGIRVSSKDGELVKWSDTILNVFIKDPNGLNLELVGTVPGVSPVTAPTTPGRGAARP
jgi:catechol 2,3-dioxygenase-like lactoylglutathione lyase family enzyme